MGKEALPKITLRYNGLFDFDGLYSAVIDWAKNYGYMWHEVDYKHKVPSPAGAEQELKWLVKKNVTEYIHYEILITVHIWDLTEMEVEIDNKVKPLSNARLYIVIDPTVTYDWQKIGKGGKLTSKLTAWYTKLTQRDQDVYLDQLYYRVWNLHAILKKYFDIQSKKYAYKDYLSEG